MSYRQTWMYVSRLQNLRGWKWWRASIGTWLARLIQTLCGWITHHEASVTEWGYGGGEFCDRWCRWCNLKMSESAATSIGLARWKSQGLPLPGDDTEPPGQEQ